MQSLWIYSVIHTVTNTVFTVIHKQHSMKINCVLGFHRKTTKLLHLAENILKISVARWYVSINQINSQFSLALRHRIHFQLRVAIQEFTRTFSKIMIGFEISQVRFSRTPTQRFKSRFSLNELYELGQKIIEQSATRFQWSKFILIKSFTTSKPTRFEPKNCFFSRYELGPFSSSFMRWPVVGCHLEWFRKF